MPKIVRVYAETQSFEILQKINEAGWLDGIKNKLGMMKKEEPKPAPKEEPSSVSDEMASEVHGGALENVINSLTDKTSGKTRMVIHMSREDLMNHYLKKDPAAHAQLAANIAASIAKTPAPAPKKKAVKKPAVAPQAKPAEPPQAAQAATPAAPAGTEASESFLKNSPILAEIFGKPAQQAAPEQQPAPTAHANSKSMIRVLPDDSKFSSLFAGSNGLQYSVLLDVPDNLVAAFKKDPTDQANLANILNLKNYVMTISNTRAAKIAAAMDAAHGDIDEQMKSFNPDVIVNYRSKQLIKLAREQWESKFKNAHSAAAPSSSQEQGEEKPEAAPQASPEDEAQKAAQQKQRDIEITLKTLKDAGVAGNDTYGKILKKLKPTPQK